MVDGPVPSAGRTGRSPSQRAQPPGGTATSKPGNHLAARASTPPRPRTLEFRWPPAVGRPYPDLELSDDTGTTVHLSQWKGQLILLEPVGMNCPACQAFLGGNDPSPGPFGGVTPQPGLQSICTYLATYGGIQLPTPDIMHIQLLLYNMELKTPTLDDARQWVRHFGLRRQDHEIVLIADERFMSDASYNLIPGFQLIDQSFILRVDATGHHPKHDLFRDLIPTLRQLSQRQ